MNKKAYRLISFTVAFALALGGCSNAQTSATTVSLRAATSYYVSMTGNDANAGTLASPFKTITKAINAAQTGYSIYVRAGTYPAFTVSKNDLIISGYPGERPIISGGFGIQLSGSNITISDFEVTAMTSNYSAGIVSFGANNIIEANIVHDNVYANMSGIIVSGGSHNQVTDNIVYNNNKFGIGIYGAAAANNTVSRNTVYNHTLSTGDSDGIHCSGNSTQNTFNENITYGNSDDGLDTWDCTDNLIINNISHHNGGAGDGNGFKFGLGGGNIAIGNTSYSNHKCGFTSNGAGNYYEKNTSYSNEDCGFDDGWRVSGNTQTSSFINNLAYNNPTNFLKSSYTTVFIGNSEIPATATSTGVPSPTSTVWDPTLPCHKRP